MLVCRADWQRKSLQTQRVDPFPQLYLTECVIGATVPITQLHDLYRKKLRITVTGSLTPNRQGIYFL
jgi:hypothetical protein